MPKVKYDVTDVEVTSFEVPTPGVYEAVVKELTYGKSSNKNDMFTVVFEITKGDYKGSRLWHYIVPESAEFRLREFTDALGLKPKGEIDTDKHVGSVVQLRTGIEPARDGYDEKARVKNVMALPGATPGSADDDDDEAPYEEWETDELKEEVEARGINLTVRKTKAAMVKALELHDLAEAGEEASEEEEEEEEEEAEEESEDETLTRDDLDQLNRTELKALIKDQELTVKVLKSDSDDNLREKIATALELDSEEEAEEEEEESEESEDDDPPPYEEWEVNDLKAECKERGLKPEGRKSVLVARLKKDDESGAEPF